MGTKVAIEDVDTGWKTLLRRMATWEELGIRVGVLSDEPHGDEEGAITLGELAAVMEFGTEDGHIPARPFLRPVFDERREEIYSYYEKLLGRMIDGELTEKQVHDLLGARLTVYVKERIRSSVPPPNAPSTVAKKRSTTTLIDTRQLLNSVTWEEDGSEGDND